MPIHIVNPLTIKLVGGVLDGDCFELVPNGSILPPMRLSYPYRDRFPNSTTCVMEEFACWLHYECKEIPEWIDGNLEYNYVGKEKMATDR